MFVPQCLDWLPISFFVCLIFKLDRLLQGRLSTGLYNWLIIIIIYQILFHVLSLFNRMFSIFVFELKFVILTQRLNTISFSQILYFFVDFRFDWISKKIPENKYIIKAYLSIIFGTLRTRNRIKHRFARIQMYLFLLVLTLFLANRNSSLNLNF